MATANRGQATSLIFFFLTLGVAAMVFWFTDPVNQEVIGEARNTTSDPVALEGIQYMELMGDNVLFIILLIAILGLITYAVYERGLV